MGWQRASSWRIPRRGLKHEWVAPSQTEDRQRPRAMHSTGPSVPIQAATLAVMATTWERSCFQMVRYLSAVSRNS
eukprot:9020834-Pyramimonas_sp.AAC.1